MHEHVTCKLKNVMGSAQSKPTKTHPKNFTKTSSVLKTPKNFQKPKNLGLMHEMHEE